MLKERKPLLENIEKSRSSRALLYVTGDRPQMETQIGKDALDLLVHHLDLIEHAKKITLYLYTNGGDVIASWSIANLIRQFCDEFEVIVSAKALSGGTLICLGADNIVMTKQAVLGPIDPSTNSPLNPQVPGAPPHAKAPVSVEAITGYLDFARQTLGKDADLKEVFVQLANSIHPHVLGQAFRSRSQIRMLAKKLLGTHSSEKSPDKKRGTLWDYRSSARMISFTSKFELFSRISRRSWNCALPMTQTFISQARTLLRTASNAL